ncbi:MAG: hypothetical protein A2Z04_00920 [Chloroflexi bacterium RBG_16_57_9]|nr:MAG: hypothetical protein A2Z04_00920 [Chloroflexi bacterium RBG_16_57_9]
MNEQNLLKLYRRPLKWLGAGLGAMAALAAAYTAVNKTELVRVEHLTLPFPNLPEGLEGLTIAQLSDLHLGWFDSITAIHRGIDLALAQRPDVIVLTGDFVHRPRPDQAQRCAKVIGRLRAPLGVYAIFGNHDHYGDARVVERPLRDVGIDVLRNEHRRITVDGAHLWLLGLDDAREGWGDWPRMLRGVPPEGFKVLLAHEPDLADTSAHLGIDLQLSGHTHGGQVCLPGLPQVWLPTYGRRYRSGLYRVGPMWLYTNRGLGSAIPPLRINCPPEVTIIRLTSKERNSHHDGSSTPG